MALNYCFIFISSFCGSVIAVGQDFARWFFCSMWFQLKSLSHFQLIGDMSGLVWSGLVWSGLELLPKCLIRQAGSWCWSVAGSFARPLAGAASWGCFLGLLELPSSMAARLQEGKGVPGSWGEQYQAFYDLTLEVSEHHFQNVLLVTQANPARDNLRGVESVSILQW